MHIRSGQVNTEEVRTKILKRDYGIKVRANRPRPRKRKPLVIYVTVHRKQRETDIGLRQNARVGGGGTLLGAGNVRPVSFTSDLLCDGWEEPYTRYSEPLRPTWLPFYNKV